MEIKPIRNDEDHQAALAVIEQLWDAEPGTEDADKLEVLATLVEAYEEKRHPILPPSPVDALLFRMDQLGLTRRDLEPYIGSRARVSEILNGNRNLTLNMIRRLHAGLGIPADVLIQQTQRKTA
jgi:HTH-type transcriptional regulator/antitoxin HigA